MLNANTLKDLIVISIIVSFISTMLNGMGILQYPFGASDGTIWNIGFIIGLIFAIISIRLVLLLPEKSTS